VVFGPAGEAEQRSHPRSSTRSSTGDGLRLEEREEVMSAALTISSSPSLVLPAGALFHPKMLQIGPSTSKVEYQQLCSGLAKIDDAEKIWICDAVLFGMNKFGKEEGSELAHTATGYTKGTCKKLAYIAERFTPEHRPDGFTRAHFKALLPFPQDWLNSWLPTVCDCRLSASSIRALAVESFGSDPSQRPMRKMRAVSIPAALYARLAEVSPTQKVSTLAEAIFIEWLGRSPEEQQFCIAVAAEQKRQQKNERQRQRNAKRAEREAERKAARDKREAEALARKEEIAAFKEAERTKLSADKEAERAAAIAAKAKKKAVAHCQKIAEFTKRQGKHSQWATKSEADEVIKNAPHLESYACDCGQFHIRRAVGACPSDGKLSDDTSPSSQTSAA
jgi:hypothetical protein